MIWTPSTSRNEKVPAVVLRLLAPPDRRSSGGYGANAYGAITDDMYPISLSYGKDGAELTCRVRNDFAICSNDDNLHKSLAGYWATLEYRPNTNNRALQKVLFRGVVSSESYQMSANENGVDVTFWDRLALADDVVELIIGYYNIGTVLSMIDNMDIWPKDANDNRLAGIDPALFDRMEWTGHYSIDGLPVPQAFASVFQNQKKDIPDIVYDGGTMLLTTRKRGDKEIDITVGCINVAKRTKRYDVDLRSLRGVKDYSRMVTRITGRGDLTRKADTFSLEPAWDRSLDAAVLADPSLPDRHPMYRAVGRRYLVPAKLWPYNATANLYGQFKPDLWAKRPDDTEWMKIENDGMIEPGYVDEDDPLRARSLSGYTDNNLRYVWFASTKIYYYYTRSQMIQRSEGAFVKPSLGFAELQLTALYQDDVLEYDTGYRGDYPIRRRRIYRNREYSRLTVGDYYKPNNDMIKGRVWTVAPVYDFSGPLTNECNDAIEVSSRPYASFTAVLTRCNFNLHRGMRVRNIYDRDGRLIFEDVGWYIESIKHTFNTGKEGSYSTELNFDSSADDLLGGIVL